MIWWEKTNACGATYQANTEEKAYRRWHRSAKRGQEKSKTMTLDKPKILQSALMDFVTSQCEGVAVCVSCRCWHTHPVLCVLFLLRLVLPGGCCLWNRPGGFSTLKSKRALPRAPDAIHSWDFRLWELIPRGIWQGKSHTQIPCTWIKSPNSLSVAK